MLWMMGVYSRKRQKRFENAKCDPTLGRLRNLVVIRATSAIYYSDVPLHFLGNDKYKFCCIQRHNEYFLAERKLALCALNLNVHA